jgi:plasmid stability protein
MAQALIRKIKDETLEAFRAAAREKGRSLEAELRELIESNRPVRKKNCAELLRLSKELQAMTPPFGPDTSDSTLLIRWDRDTDHGKSLDDGWANDDAGR